MAIDDADVSALCIETPSPKTVLGITRNSVHSKSDEEESSGGWTPLLVLCGITSCLGSALPAGYNIGVINNPAQLLEQYCNESIIRNYNIHLTEDSLNLLWSAIVSIFLIGGVTGSLVSSWLADKYGRKGALAAGNICGTIGAILFLLIPSFHSVELFLAGRLVVGLSGGLATSLLSMYMSEIAPIKLRGSVGVLCQLGITVGVFLGQAASLNSTLGTEDKWHLMLAAFSPLCVLSLILLFFLPESPKYLYIIKEQKENALKALSSLRNVDITLLQDEIAALQREAIAAQAHTETWSIGRVVRDSNLKLPLFMVCLLQFSQQLSGINAVFYYSNSIFKIAGLSTTESEYATLGTGIINILMAVVSVPVMLHFSRRNVLLISCYLCIGCLITLCVSISLIHASSFMPWVCVVAVLAYVLFYGIGLGPIPYFIGSELFDVGPRPVAMSLGSVFNWGGNFIVGMLFPLFVSIINAYTFLIFAGCVLLLACLVKMYLPETRGKNTMEIASLMTHGFKSRPNHILAI